MKPEKTIYADQKEIHDLIIDKLKPYLKNVKEAYLIGSLSEGKFGQYIEKYEGFYGSDIDVVIIPIKILSEWKYEGEFYNWHKRYNAGIIKIKDIEHPINFMIPFNNNLDLFWQKAKELKWKVEKLK
ncbi:MAG: hypothetical protein AABW80_05270 [Nanoarchaeota archaeon]